MRSVLIFLLAAVLLSCDQMGPSLDPTTASSPKTLALGDVPESGLLPDLQTVVPLQIKPVNQQGGDWLRFSNGVANTGDGPLHIEPVFPLPDEDETQGAIQKVFDADGNVVWSGEVSEYEYHPEHNHWHIAKVAEYSVRAGSPEGEIVGERPAKVTFCLIDWVKLDGNSHTTERVYWDCSATAASQGISPGWVDQYHHSLPDQEVNLSGVPEGDYYLVSTANPDNVFLEETTLNNTAWVKFRLTRSNSGNVKVEILETSPCTGGLCGASTNR